MTHETTSAAPGGETMTPNTHEPTPGEIRAQIRRVRETVERGDIADMLAIIREARDEISRLCQGRGGTTSAGLAGRGWTMTVPVHASDSDMTLSRVCELAERLAASLASTPTRTATDAEAVNDLIVSFLDDCMSGGYDFAFRHTQHHGGVRSQEEGGVTVVWINSPIGNPDEGGFSAEGETFAEAMIEYIREAGTPKCVAELEEALRPTARNSRATQSEDSNDDASKDAGAVSREGERHHEDNTYAKWTPSGSLSLDITNPALHGKFSQGQTFYVDFTPAE
jgi:hypothetical protein